MDPETKTEINALYLGCGDPRLWDTHADLRAQLTKNKGLKLYNLLVPGPDEGANGDSEHFEAMFFFVKRFYDLTKFKELHFAVHADCAGCQVSDERHIELANMQKENLTKGLDFDGDIFLHLMSKPVGSECVIWATEPIS